jgi:multidrug efflux pump subunit AcrB
MLSRIFIERPRLAIVISILITLSGALALFNIPVAQYPQISPPEIRVSAVYPGASAEVVADSVAAPLEDGNQRRRGHALHVFHLFQ